MKDLETTDKAVLALCNTLHNLAGYTATLVRDECEEWVSAIYEAIELLQTHAGNSDLVELTDIDKAVLLVPTPDELAGM